MFACLYRPSAPDGTVALDRIARDYSPRYECHGDAVVGETVVLDVSGMTRLFGSPRAMADEMRRDAASRGVRVHVAMAGTRTAATLLAHAHVGVTVVMPGDEAEALAGLPLASLAALETSDFELQTYGEVWKRWGLRTLCELAALPPDDLAARLGREALMWHAMARGADIRPLVPSLDEERFEATCELEWPIEELEPLSFVLTRLLEPLATRLERRDRGAAVLHVVLRLITKELYARRLELPSPMRDVRTLRTLALLDLESHPPVAAIDRVTIVIDPTPGRVLQHTLFSRALPTPEQLSTLVARLGAVMGPDRVGAPATVDTYRPGAFAMRPFKTDHEAGGAGRAGRAGGSDTKISVSSTYPPFPPDQHYPPIASAIRRCRQPVPARVAVEGGRPVRVTTDRRGFAGGVVVRCAGPWRTSGAWWAGKAGYWNRDEWDVALGDGAVYRIFQDRDTEAWFIDAIVD